MHEQDMPGYRTGSTQPVMAMDACDCSPAAAAAAYDES